MTENTPKKPRRKRRTKAEIEAEKTVDLPKEVLEETVTSAAPANEEVAESAPKSVSRDPEPYVPQTGINKIRKRLSQRNLREQHYEATRNKK